MWAKEITKYDNNRDLTAWSSAQFIYVPGHNRNVKFFSLKLASSPPLLLVSDRAVSCRLTDCGRTPGVTTFVSFFAVGR